MNQIVTVDEFAQVTADIETIAYDVENALNTPEAEHAMVLDGFTRSEVAAMLHVVIRGNLPLCLPRERALPQRSTEERNRLEWLNGLLLRARCSGHDNDADLLLDQLLAETSRSQRKAYIRTSRALCVRASKNTGNPQRRARLLCQAALARYASSRI